MPDGPISCLRPGVSTDYAFKVQEANHVAKLDQNESPVDLPADIKTAILDDLAAYPWNRYITDAQYRESKAHVADVVGVPADCLALTSGADGGLEAGFVIAGGPGRCAGWFEPGYPYIAHLATRTQTPLRAWSVAGWTPADLDGIDLAIIVSPNNPTGVPVAPSIIDAALDSPSRLVIVDEAYADFSADTVLSDAPRRSNMMVVRSCSKAFIAGVHVGFVVANPTIIGAIESTYSAPFHLNALQIAAAARYGQIRDAVAATVHSIIAERERVTDALNELPRIMARPSQGNFVLFDTGRDASTLARELARGGVTLRDVSGLPTLAGHLRVTIGTADQNDAFLSALRSVLQAG